MLSVEIEPTIIPVINNRVVTRLELHPRRRFVRSAPFDHRRGILSANCSRQIRHLGELYLRTIEGKVPRPLLTVHLAPRFEILERVGKKREKEEKAKRREKKRPPFPANSAEFDKRP